MESTAPNSQAQQYNLKWTNHTYNMLQTFTEQLSKENFVDCTLACDGQYLKVHKMILSGCSYYFQQLFETYKEQNPLIIMNGVKFTNLKQIIEFMYHGEVKIAEEELESLLALAENFKVKGLSNVRNKKLAKDNENESNAKKRKLSGDSDKDATESIDDKEIEEPPETPEAIEVEEHAPTINSLPEAQTPDYKIDKRPRILKRIEPPKVQAPSTSTTTTTTTITAVAIEEQDPLKIVEVSKIPRPPNAFMIFANEWRRKIADEHPGENNKEISVHLGNMWKQLAKHEKDKYYQAAHLADREHKTKYPGYYYSPKEARMRKEMKSIQNKKKPFVAGHFLLLSSDEEAHPTDVLDVSN